MEKQYKNILVAVDGSARSEKAFEEALNVSKAHNSQLFIVYIESEIVPYREGLDETARLRKQIAGPLLDKVERARTFGVEKVETLVESGNPKTYLAKILPEELQIDVIFMGASQSGILSKGLIGSTVSYVLKHAPCLVQVIK
ncbi:universal stress protein [Vagococcus sp. BWB3-3]|uniref:Universal stress protein n=1 Tax=Vagococcus allomyrinae TaxID=2794353 RepID=A0A940P216_9ENTE|nr:universal stress protein [Vagococcus allomyrinae]MBP1040027.1 universal stress protein [Vagococcus allomyrinae]